MMSIDLNECFIVLTVSCRKGKSLYFPYPMIKILLLTLLELEIKKRDDIVFQDKKIPQGVSKAIMQF